MRPNLPALFLAAIAAFLAPALAQQPRALTASDYERAERFLAPNLTTLVVGGSVSPVWLPGERFWYRSTTRSGAEFVLVDAVKRQRTPAFDHVRLAAALSAAAGE